MWFTCKTCTKEAFAAATAAAHGSLSPCLSARWLSRSRLRLRGASAGTGAHVSHDAGATWPAATLPVPAAAVALDPQNPSVAYASVFPHGLFRTLDGGNGWANVQGNARVGPILSIAVNRQEPV